MRIDFFTYTMLTILAVVFILNTTFWNGCMFAVLWLLFILILYQNAEFERRMRIK